MSRLLPLIFFLLPIADEPLPRPAQVAGSANSAVADGDQDAAPAVSDPNLPDGEADFIFSLRTRGLFDLGRQVCLQRLQTEQSLTAQATWELLFADCCEDEAWYLPQARREELISLAVSRITEFLRKAPVQPETELALRLRQLELLGAVADMECAAIGFRSVLPPAAKLDFARSACSQGIQLATAQLKFADELRPLLPPATLREVRFRLRCTLLELQLSAHRLASPRANSAGPPAGPAAESMASLRSEAEQLLRGLADQYQFRARHLLAQILLEHGDDTALELQLRSLAANATSVSEQRRLETLQRTRLLRLRRPSELLARDAQPSGLLPADAAKDPELQLLLLHARLLLCELLSEIEQTRRAGDRSSLTDAVAAFESAKAEISPLLRGVWAERLQYCERRLELVLLAGPEGADAIESVTVLLAANDHDAALARLQQITRLPAASADLRALARMQIGELLLRESRWTEAVAELETSAGEFAACHRPRQQAAADLLRLYGMAQLHRTTPQANPAPGHYRAALDQHIQMFADQPTIATAREYRALLLRASHPLEAAADLLAIPAPSSDASPADVRQHLRKLALLGDCLLEASLNGVARNETADIVAARSTQLQPWLQQIDAAAAPEPTVVALQRLTAPLVFQQSDPGPLEDWGVLQAELRRLLQILDAAAAVSPATPGDLSADSFDFSAVAARTRASAQTFRLLAASRLLLPEQELQGAEAAIRQLPPAVQREQVLLLLPHLADPRAPGSTALAMFASGLLPAATAPDRTAASLLRDLPILLRLQSCGAPAEPAAAILTALIRQPLTPEQLQQTAEVLATVNPGSVGAAFGSGAAGAAEFWRRIQGQTTAGEPAWLEASLQLAAIAAATNQKNEALRILRTISVLHPTWGSAERRQRAAELLKSLERPR